MSQEQTVFSQILQFVSYDDFRICVRRYDGNKGVRRFSCWEQFLAMAFAQLTHRESLRDIEVCLAAHQKDLYRSGFRSLVKRSTLADANENRDWRIYSDFAHSLIKRARPLYADTDLGLDLDATVYALDATTIDLCLSLFPWASFRRAKGAVKLHTMIDLQSAIPVFIDITHGKIHDVNALDHIIPQPGSYIVMDRGYIDFHRLYALHQAMTYFVIRAKADLQFRRRQSRQIDKTTGLRSDQTIRLTGPKTSGLYPVPLRRVSYYSEEIDKRFVFLTNDFLLPPLTVAAIYPQPVAGRTVLQMDQTAFADQAFLRHLPKLRQNPGLDCGCRLRPDRHYQKTIGIAAFSQHHSANSFHNAFRENARPACVSAL